MGDVLEALESRLARLETILSADEGDTSTGRSLTESLAAGVAHLNEVSHREAAQASMKLCRKKCEECCGRFW